MDENTKRAAQEYLATKMTEERQLEENKLNREAAAALAPAVWKRFADTVLAKCEEWNSVTGEKTLTCKETWTGDLRVLCAGRSQQLTIHYDSRKLQVTIRNTARAEHEKDIVLHIEGYATESGREARLVRNEELVNAGMLIVWQLRVLSGIGAQTGA